MRRSRGGRNSRWTALVTGDEAGLGERDEAEQEGGSKSSGMRGARALTGLEWCGRRRWTRGSGRIPMWDLIVAAARRNDGTVPLDFRVGLIRI